MFDFWENFKLLKMVRKVNTGNRGQAHFFGISGQ